MARRHLIGEILNTAGGLPNLRKQVAYLQEQRTLALIHILALCLDPRARFDLPKGETPVTPDEYGTGVTLYQTFKQLYIYLEPPKEGEQPFPNGGHVPQAKKIDLWQKMMKQLPELDRQALDSIKDKKLPFLLKETPVIKAFPELDFSNGSGTDLKARA
jgi:hypothetical protein